jgi:cytochrome c oxidase subunit 4
MTSTTHDHDHAGHDHGHGDHDSPEYIKKSIRKYVMIGGILWVLTVVTVVLGQVDLPITQAIVLGMMVAVTKASLVALFFMHLIDEKKLIYYTLLLTVTFFAVCMIIPATTTREGDSRAPALIYERPAKEERHTKPAHGGEGDHGKPEGDAAGHH